MSQTPALSHGGAETIDTPRRRRFGSLSARLIANIGGIECSAIRAANRHYFLHDARAFAPSGDR
jgi:hypothetical protein